MYNVEIKSALGLLTLLSIRGVGPATTERIAKTFTYLGDLVSQSPHEQFKASRMPPAAFSERSVLEAAYENSKRILDQADKTFVKVITVFDTNYPATLKGISDRPPVIYVRGELPENCRLAACIGTREPSEFGIKVTKRISEYLTEHGWSIVSGLAVGIDTIAHIAAVQSAGRTIAVMAGGLDSIYPKANTKLAQEILETGGALIGEHPFGVPPTPRNLVQRDRIQSGLSIGTFVMQTDIVGGSMHTVRYTIQQNRLLFAPVPFGRHASELKSRGILALTKMNGSEFAEAIGAKDEYRKLLIAKFPNSPVARGIYHRDEYDDILGCLEEQHTVKFKQNSNISFSQERLI